MLGPASAQGVEKSGVLCHIEIFARLRGPRAAQKIGIHRGEVTEDPRKDMENSMEMTQPLSFIISSHIKKGKFQLAG